MNNSLLQLQQMLLGNTSKVQEQMDDLQKTLGDLVAVGNAGGQMVQVTVNGKRRVTKVHLDFQSGEDSEMMEDLIATATNDALNKIEATIQEKMQSSILGSLTKLS